jgi:hypothetical protein
MSIENTATFYESINSLFLTTSEKVTNINIYLIGTSTTSTCNNSAYNDGGIVSNYSWTECYSTFDLY